MGLSEQAYRDDPTMDRLSEAKKELSRRIRFPHVSQELPGIPDESYATQELFEVVKAMAARLEEYDKYRAMVQEHVDHHERILKWVDNERAHLREFLEKMEPSQTGRSSNSYDH